MVGNHLSNHAKPRMMALVIFGTTTNRISSQWWPISSFMGSVTSVARILPISDPSTCLNHMEFARGFILVTMLGDSGEDDQAVGASYVYDGLYFALDSCFWNH